MTFKQRLEGGMEQARQICGEEHPKLRNSEYSDPKVGVGWCAELARGEPAGTREERSSER